MHFRTLHELWQTGVSNLRNRSIGSLYQSIHGAASETTLRRNQEGFKRLALKQFTVRDVRERNIAGRFLGLDTPTPVMVAPWGAHRVVHDAGEVGTAIGTGANMMALSTATNFTPEEVIASSEGPRIFQLYLFAGGEWLRDLIESVIDLGFVAIVLVVDVQVASRRDRSIEVPVPAPLNFPLPLLAAAFNDPTFDPSFPLLASTDWNQVRRIRDQIGGRVPFGLKGILTAEDAAIARQEGMDFIWVSNHGGRQLDYTQTPIDVLPQIVLAAKGKAGSDRAEAWPFFPPGWQHDREQRPQIVVDSGFRWGTDVLHALALGADMVAMGKNFQMALSAEGESGVASMFDLLATEIDVNLALSGHRNVYDLGPGDIVKVDYPVERSSPDRSIPELHT